MFLIIISSHQSSELNENRFEIIYKVLTFITVSNVQIYKRYEYSNLKITNYEKLPQLLFPKIITKKLSSTSRSLSIIIMTMSPDYELKR